jgi:hypothetical protein
MTPKLDRKVLVFGKSLLLCAIAGHLHGTPGFDVQIAQGLAQTAGANFAPDVVLMENDRSASDASSRSALRLFVDGTAASVFLLDMESSALTVLSSQTVPVRSLSELIAKIAEASH